MPLCSLGHLTGWLDLRLLLMIKSMVFWLTWSDLPSHWLLLRYCRDLLAVCMPLLSSAHSFILLGHWRSTPTQALKAIRTTHSSVCFPLPLIDVYSMCYRSFVKEPAYSLIKGAHDRTSEEWEPNGSIPQPAPFYTEFLPFVYKPPKCIMYPKNIFFSAHPFSLPSLWIHALITKPHTSCMKQIIIEHNLMMIHSYALVLSRSCPETPPYVSPPCPFKVKIHRTTTYLHTNCPVPKTYVPQIFVRHDIYARASVSAPTYISVLPA